MAISINPLVSPRIITVLAPATDITMQELVDDVRDWEDEQIDMEYDYILSAAGKEPLGGGVLVGITVTLHNAKLAFEARPGPDFVQCNATGGNLVAEDEFGNIMSAIQVTAFTQVILTSSSSATLQELDAIQYASYANAVHINWVSGVDGIDYPCGTPEHPVKTLTVAVAIATARGFNVFVFHSDFTFGPATYVANLTFRGEGMQKTTFTFQAGCVVAYCFVENAKITGAEMGLIGMTDCHVYNLGSVSPIPVSNSIVVRDCLVGGTISLPVTYSGTLLSINCWSEANGVVINYGGATFTLAVRNFTGTVTHINNSGNATLTADMSSGKTTLNASCSTGTYAIRGVGLLVDQSTGTAVVDATGLVSAELIQFASFGGHVTIDAVNGVEGTAFPAGNEANPVKTLADAQTIAAIRGFKEFYFLSDFTFITGSYVDSFKIRGKGLTQTTFTFQSGSVTPYCAIEDAKVTGDILGLVSMTRAHIFNIGSTALIPSSQGLLIQDSLISGSLALPTLYSGITQLINCWTEGTPSEVDLGGATAMLIVRGFMGEVTLTNNTAGTNITVDMTSGKVILDPTCSSGTYTFRGVGLLDNQSTGTAVVDQTGLVSADLLQTASFNGYVTIDVINGEAGTDFPIGNETHPVDNLVQALVIAASRGFNSFRVRGSLDIEATADVSNLTFIGDGMVGSSIIMTAGCVTSKTTFRDASVVGVQNGEVNYAICSIGELDSARGVFLSCRLLGPISCDAVSTDVIVMKDCYSGDAGGLPTVINMDNSPSSLSNNSFNGVLQFQNFNKNPGAGVIMVGIQTGKIIVDATCTKGDIFIRGVCEIDNSAAGTVVNVAGAIDTVAVDRTNKNAALIPAAL